MTRADPATMGSALYRDLHPGARRDEWPAISPETRERYTRAAVARFDAGRASRDGEVEVLRAEVATARAEGAESERSAIEQWLRAHHSDHLANVVGGKVGGAQADALAAIRRRRSE